MPRKARKQIETPQGLNFGPVKWLRAKYHFHVFHYRMPDTVAIAAVTPFVPSPLTVKMGLVAALLQNGDNNSAQALVPYLPRMEVRIIPPLSALSFKAFLRYRSVPGPPRQDPQTRAIIPRGLDESGSYYPSRPHTREYAIFSNELTVLVGLPNVEISQIVRKALYHIRYMGCKDSIVTCLSVEEVPDYVVQSLRDFSVKPLQEGVSGPVIFAMDFDSSANLGSIRELIPGSRQEEHYTRRLWVLPGKIFSKGRTRIFCRR